jgi:hypothetical protein
MKLLPTTGVAHGEGVGFSVRNNNTVSRCKCSRNGTGLGA